MILLKSYPKSGNTWLRFILCNLLYPDVEHDFSTIKKYCPTFEEEDENKEFKKWLFDDSISHPIKLMKTHAIDIEYGNTIYIHRHVGDVLISFWWHCKKFFDEQRTFEQFCEELNFGEGWREFVNKSSLNYIKYEDIDNIDRLKLVTGLDYSYYEWIRAIKKSRFDKIRNIEDEKGLDTESRDDIKFCRNGKSEQYTEVDIKLTLKILEENKKELKLLGYAD